MEVIKDSGLVRYPGDSYDAGLMQKDRSRTRSKAKKKIKVNIYTIKLSLIISGLFCSLLLIGYIATGNTKIMNLNSKNTILQSENKELELIISDLEAKLQPYSSKERIEKIASTKLEMIYPSEANVVELRQDMISEVLANQEVASEELALQE